MAHELHIDAATGKASMFYVEQVPWHGLGWKLDKVATSAEAIKAANLDWNVNKYPLHVVSGRVSQPVPNRFAIVRQDQWGRKDCPVLGIVGGDYTPIQNREAFAFFDGIVGQGAAIYHTAGALGYGERVWILAKLPSQIIVTKEDVADKYLLLANSHDGSSAVQVKFTPIRVVCQNTLTMALSSGPRVRVAHTKQVRQRLQEAARLLGIINAQFDSIGETFQRMTRLLVNKNRLAEYLLAVFPDPKPETSTDDPSHQNALKRVADTRLWAEYFFDQGKGNRLVGVAGSLWAAYNGVTEYIDHRSTPNLTADGRLDSLWFGDGYYTKARAFRIAEEKLNDWSRN